jgi:hypothetical protein
MPFSPHVTVIAHDGIQNGSKHAAVDAAVTLKPIEHELGDWSISDQVGSP